MNTVTTIPHSDNAILQGLLQHDSRIINGIYERMARKVQFFITENNGLEEEAGDIFQETLIDIYKMADQGKLVLTCPFDAFFMMVVKRKWYNVLKSSSRKGVTNNDAALSVIEEDSFRDAEIIAENGYKEKVYRQELQKLSDRCQEVIKATLQKKPQEEIATALGVSYSYLRKKKSECLDQLIINIKKVYR